VVRLAPEEARERLAAMPGLGPWSAAEITAVAMGDADAVPVGDYNLPNLVAHALAGVPRGDDAMMLELLEPYRGHRGRVIRLLVAGGIRPPRFGPRLALRHLERH
jgi:3-methyladenine DNA glycosylase/8-oxoguanine DNA glycosylase